MKTKLSPQAVHLLKRVKEQILKYPETYQHHYVCGSACCISGWIAKFNDYKGENTYEHAFQYLGVPQDFDHPLRLHLFAFTNPRSMNGILKESAAWGAAKIDEFIAEHT